MTARTPSAKARTLDNIAVLVVLAVFILAIYLSFGYGFRARLVPVVVASFGVIVLVAQLILQNLKGGSSLEIDALDLISRGATDHVPPVDLAREPSRKTAKNGGPFERKWLREILGMALVVAFLAGFVVIGPLPAVFLLMAGYLVASGYAGLVRALLYAAATTLAIHIVFTAWLGVDLDVGLVKIGTDWL